MKLFENRQSQRRERDQGIAHSVASRIERYMRRLATFMGAQSEKLSARQKKTALFIFGLMVGGICTGLIIRPFTADELKGFSIPVAINLPALTSLPLQEDSLLEQSSYKSLVRIKRTIDSLKYSNSGASRYDQLMRERPGLVDSLNTLLGEH